MLGAKKEAPKGWIFVSSSQNGRLHITALRSQSSNPREPSNHANLTVAQLFRWDVSQCGCFLGSDEDGDQLGFLLNSLLFLLVMFFQKPPRVQCPLSPLRPLLYIHIYRGPLTIVGFYPYLLVPGVRMSDPFVSRGPSP